MRGPIAALIGRAARRFRYPRLLLVTAAVFIADLALPDVIPLADEILLGLGTVVLAGLPRRRGLPTDTPPERP